MEPTQPLPGQQPGAPSGLILDGQPTTALTPTQLAQIAKEARLLPPILGQIVEYLVTDPVGFTLTTAELITAASQINSLQKAFQPLDLVRERPDYARIALAMVTDTAASTQVAQLLGVRQGLAMSGMHARAVLGYLTRWPAFAATLTGTGPDRFGVPVRIVARIDSAYGDACYLDGELLLKAFSLLHPYGYLRLFLHEAGHATFERSLLAGAVLPPEVATAAAGEIGRCVELVAQLAGSGPVGNPTAELASLQQRLPNGAATVAAIKAMSPEARNLYRAWLVLRRNGGQYLLGLDLGPSMSPAERRRYQAGDFGEFCAEGFMQAATTELAEYVRGLQPAAAGTPPEVLTAWTTAVQILLAYRKRIVGAQVR